MIKALFFDIDGTLVSFNTHHVPESTIEALTLAKKAGVEVYISTGRPFAIINNLDEIKHLIDGYITANGAYCCIGDKVISCSPIPLHEVKRIVAKCDEHGVACIVVGEKDMTMVNPDEKSLWIFNVMLNVPDVGLGTPLEKVLSQPILQLTPFITEAQEPEVIGNSDHLESGRWYPDFLDMTARGVCKAEGLRAIAAYRGFSLDETMAFGDGGNDLSIIQAAGTGVAMGNSNAVLLSAADYVTTSVDDNGIYNALRHYGVI